MKFNMKHARLSLLGFALCLLGGCAAAAPDDEANIAANTGAAESTAAIEIETGSLEILQALTAEEACIAYTEQMEKYIPPYEKLTNGIYKCFGVYSYDESEYDESVWFLGNGYAIKRYEIDSLHGMETSELYVSYDNGSTWEYVNSSEETLPSSYLMSIAYNGTILMGHTNRIYDGEYITGSSVTIARSTDTGHTWSEADFELELPEGYAVQPSAIPIYFIQDTTAVMFVRCVPADGLAENEMETLVPYGTTDAGETWHRIEGNEFENISWEETESSYSIQCPEIDLLVDDETYHLVIWCSY